MTPPPTPEFLSNDFTLEGWGWTMVLILGCVSPPFPEGPARRLDVSRQKMSPHCLETILDSRLPSPRLSPKMPPKLSLAYKREAPLFPLSKLPLR